MCRRGCFQPVGAARACCLRIAGAKNVQRTSAVAHCSGQPRSTPARGARIVSVGAASLGCKPPLHVRGARQEHQGRVASIRSRLVHVSSRAQNEGRLGHPLRHRYGYRWGGRALGRFPRSTEPPHPKRDGRTPSHATRMAHPRSTTARHERQHESSLGTARIERGS